MCGSTLTATVVCGPRLGVDRVSTVSEILLFHHAQGLTEGVLAFAEQLRLAGHTVHTPDLYEGAQFADIAAGVAHAETIGFDVISDHGVAEAEKLTEELVYAGFSLGALPAQRLAQIRPRAEGALLYHGGVPTSTFDVPWPLGVPLQLHLMDSDPWSELDVAKELRDEVPAAELYVYPGTRHLFADSSLPDYEPSAALLLLQRTLEFLDSSTDRR